MLKHTVLLILWILLLGAVPAIAGKAKKPAHVTETAYYDGGASSLASGAWRFSLDGKYYSLALSGGLRITPVRTGQFGADIPRKVNKKGRTSLEGQWRVGAYSGLLVIQDVGPISVTGQMLVPAAGAGFSVCNTRKSSVLFSLGQPQPVCNVVSVSWILQPQVSAAEMASQEMAQDLMTASTAATQQSNSSGAVDSQQPQNSALVGVWHQVTSDYGTYTENTIDIRADGTYTQTKKLRITAYSGSPTGGGTHDGQWRADGFQVHLSGGGNFPASSHNLQNFKKIR